MIPKEKRVHKSAFKEMHSRKCVSSLYFTVCFVASEKTTFACVISKKAAGKATERNKLKRRVLSILPSLTLLKTGMYLCYAKKGASGLSFANIKEDLQGLMKKFK